MSEEALAHQALAQEKSEILIGADGNGANLSINPRMANRHGLIAGATGTGKTVTLQVLAEGFSRMGVPVFTADVKGDLSGLATSGSPHKKIDERLAKISIPSYTQRGYPVLFWDLYGQSGHPIRTTISEMGPLLLGRLLELNDTQQGILEMAFTVADDQGLLLLDLKDLRSMLQWMGENAADFRNEYGNVSSQSIGAIQRRLLSLRESGGENFFGEPALRLEHLMQHDFSGNGVISILDATKLLADARLYSTFLLWLLSELFEELDEVGDPEKPRLVFFFDEAHLLFDEAPKALVEKIEQVVRLIRSKGVGVYFVTQNPIDVPDEVLGQLGHRVQHALRAFTPRDQKAVKVAAQTFRANPDVDVEEIITQLGVGEALVSVLDDKGIPTPVARTLIAPPESKIGPCDDSKRMELRNRSPIKGLYEETIDRESAFELLKKRAEERSTAEKQEQAEEAEEQAKKKSGYQRQGFAEAFFKSMIRTVGNQFGRQIIRGVLGGMMGSRRRR